MSASKSSAAALTVEEVRATVFEGLATVTVFAAAMQRTPRQVLFWISQGLPVTRIGHTPYVQVDPAREWLQRAWNQKPEPPQAA
jgi:hypothetical protein